MWWCSAHTCSLPVITLRLLRCLPSARLRRVSSRNRWVVVKSWTASTVISQNVDTVVQLSTIKPFTAYNHFCATLLTSQQLIYCTGRNTCFYQMRPTISDKKRFEVIGTSVYTLSVGLLQCFSGRNNRHSDKTAAISTQYCGWLVDCLEHDIGTTSLQSYAASTGFRCGEGSFSRPRSSYWNSSTPSHLHICNSSCRWRKFKEVLDCGRQYINWMCRRAKNTYVVGPAQRQIWFIPLADERGVCRWNCEISWERVPHLSALEMWSRQGAIQILVYLYLYIRRWASTVLPSTGTPCGTVYPSAVRDSSLALNTFHQQLKTHLCGQSWTLPGAVVTFLCDSGAGHKYHYLLTVFTWRQLRQGNHESTTTQ